MKKWFLFAMVLCFSLIIGTVSGQTAEIQESTANVVYQCPAGSKQGDFCIESGILTNYSGTKTDVVIPDTVKEIGEAAFKGNKTINSVVFPTGITKIGKQAFQNCLSLYKIDLGNTGVTEIGIDAFSYCSSLNEVTLPDSLKKIENYAFYYCSKLSEITLPYSVEMIGMEAFNNTSIVSVSLPKGIQTVLDFAFPSGTEVSAYDGKYDKDHKLSLGDWASKSGYILTEIADPTEITLSKEKASVAVGKEIKLTAKIKPSNAAPSKIVWSSDDESIASVTDNGVVKGVAEGTVTITVKIDGYPISKSCEVTVRKTGWVNKDGKWYYVDDSGEYAKDFRTIKGDVFYFNADGVMQTGWQKIDDSWYCFEGGSSGKMKTGWQKISGAWYYLDTKTGVMQTGWQQIDGSWYYFEGGSSGKMKTGWQKIDGSWYYFKEGDSGKMLTGWQKISDARYYFASNGKLQTGWQQINGAWYYFKGVDSGRMVTGWQKISSNWYYFDSNGKMQTGWQKISGNWYYLNDNGVMQTGWQKIDGSWYYFEGGSSGKMTTGWQIVDGETYYLAEPSGKRVTGWQTIDGKIYFFNSIGAMLTGEQTIGGESYTFLDTGVLKPTKPGWLLLDSK